MEGKKIRLFGSCGAFDLTRSAQPEQCKKIKNFKACMLDFLNELSIYDSR